MTQDEEQLKLLSVFHYVIGGLAGLFALFPIFHLIFGLMMILAPHQFGGSREPPLLLMGWFFVIFATAFIILGWVFAGVVITAGRFLAKQKHHSFCLVVAGVECIFMPFGTVLGVFTIIVLMRESVKQRFGVNHPPPPAAIPAVPGGG